MVDAQVCDESKCRSPGLLGGPDIIRYDCYTSSPEEPPLCADGYVGRFVDESSTSIAHRRALSKSPYRKLDDTNEIAIDDYTDTEPSPSCSINVNLTGCPKDPLVRLDNNCEDGFKVMTFKYDGLDCNSSNDLKTRHNFTCADTNGGPPTPEGSQSYIVATSKEGNDIYFSGHVAVGNKFVLNANEQFDMLSADMIISIYSFNAHGGSSPTESKLLQRLDLHLSCSVDLFLLDRFGASQVQEWIEISDRRVASIPVEPVIGTIGVTLDTFNSENPVRLLEMAFLTNRQDQPVDYTSKVADIILQPESTLELPSFYFEPEKAYYANRFTFFTTIIGESIDGKGMCNNFDNIECIVRFNSGGRPDPYENFGYHKYYTCCPEDYNSTIKRQCSDPMQTKEYKGETEIINADPMPCHEHGEKMNPRQMANSSFYPKTYLCCEHDINITASTPVIAQEETTGDIIATCDESKCISNIFQKSCWGGGPGSLYPFRCDDGYEGRLVGTEPLMWSSLYGNLSYYTCCPPQYQIDVAAQRHCSEPNELVGESTNLTCDSNSLLKYPRRMKPFYSGFSYDSISENYSEMQEEKYICCDSLVDENVETNFLDEIDCVPRCFEDSRDDFMQCLNTNSYGKLQAMVCASDDVFIFPRRVHTESFLDDQNMTSDLTLYECCKNKSDTTGPFIQDAAFNLTVWPQIVLSLLAVVFSLVLITGLSVSLRKQWRTRSSKSKQGFNGYNFYLVLLAVPDMVLNLFVIGLYGSYANQIYSAQFAGHVVFAWYGTDEEIPLDTAVIQACSTANLYLNAVVAYEVLVLLKNSNRLQRQRPPSLRKVAIQATVVYSFSIIIFLCHYFLVGKFPMKIVASVSFMVTAGFPIIYLGYVCFVIWRRKLVPSLDRKTRGLAFFFFRIILVFIVIWLPAMILLSISFAGYERSRDFLEYMRLKKNVNQYFYPIGLLLCAVQPIVSTSVALTKDDVRAAIFDLMPFSDFGRPNRPKQNRPTNVTASITRTSYPQEEKTEEKTSAPSIASPNHHRLEDVEEQIEEQTVAASMVSPNCRQHEGAEEEKMEE